MKHLLTLHTQDNLATADPLFVVFEKDRIYGLEEGSGTYEWRDEDGDLAAEEECAELEKLKDEGGGDTGLDLNGTKFSAIQFGERDRFVTACFTRKGAEDYLAANGHNLTKPFIYVSSLYRNREMIEVRQHLMATHRPQSPWQPPAKR
jgi:hypothetical protein